jgi:putative hydrolase of the HAD superfamily
VRYPFVLFDVGDTLIGPRQSYGAVYSEVLARLGLALPAEDLDNSIRQTAIELRRQIPPGTDRFSYFPGGEPEFWMRFARSSIGLAAGRPIEEAFARSVLGELREVFREPTVWQVFDDVRPTLIQLVAQGCRLGVVSNWDSRLPGLLERLDLARYFEVIGVSRLEGVEKPDPVFFLRVLERLGGSAELALHVGNHPDEDLAGAGAAGIDGLLVDRAGCLEDAQAAVTDLSGLPGRVRG